MSRLHDKTLRALLTGGPMSRDALISATGLYTFEADEVIRTLITAGLIADDVTAATNRLSLTGRGADAAREVTP